MNQVTDQQIIEILRKEAVPALGCTEPVACALAVSYTHLGSTTRNNNSIGYQSLSGQTQSSNLHLGRVHQSGWNYFKGCIQDFVLWRTAIPDAQIDKIHDYYQRHGKMCIRDSPHTDMTEKLPAGVSFGPYQLLNGLCVLTDVGDRNVEFYISPAKNSFWGKARERRLDESCEGQFTHSPGNQTYTLEQFYKSLKEQMDYVVCPCLLYTSIYATYFWR